MNKIKIITVLTILFIFNTNVYANFLEIKVKVKNEIITNIDIEKEKKYLYFLNPKLQELEKSKIDKIAKESLITEIVKKNELKKFFEFDLSSNLLNSVEKNLFKRKNIRDKEEFLKILSSKNLDYEIIRQKLYIEMLWNQLIFKKYSMNVVLNEDELRKNILDKITKEKKTFTYNLSEIFFSENAGGEINKKIFEINKSITKIGFENTANIYSTSNTSNKGGLIGWINELQISSIIGNKIKKLEIGDISEPIKLQNGYIIIKLNDKKEFKKEINVNDQLKRLIKNETNRQLNTFSTILYKKLKKNTDIDEF